MGRNGAKQCKNTILYAYKMKGYDMKYKNKVSVQNTDWPELNKAYKGVSIRGLRQLQLIEGTRVQS